MSDKLYDDFHDRPKNPGESLEDFEQRRREPWIDRAELRQLMYNAHRSVYGKNSNRRLVSSVDERLKQSDSTRRSVYELVEWVKSGAELTDANTTAGDLNAAAGILHAASSKYMVGDVAEEAYDKYIEMDQADQRDRRALAEARASGEFLRSVIEELFRR